MPQEEQSRLDREIEEILAKKRLEPISFADHVDERRRAQRLDGKALLNELKTWYLQLPLLSAFVLVILARLINGFTPLLAAILVATAVAALWIPGLRTLGQSHASQEPTVHYWRGQKYTTPVKDAVSRHPVDSLKRFFDSRR